VIGRSITSPGKNSSSAGNIPRTYLFLLLSPFTFEPFGLELGAERLSASSNLEPLNLEPIVPISLPYLSTTIQVAFSYLF